MYFFGGRRLNTAWWYIYSCQCFFFFGIYFIHVNYELYLISTNILLLETLLFGSWKLECNLLQSLITVKLVAMLFDHLSWIFFMRLPINFSDINLRTVLMCSFISHFRNCVWFLNIWIIHSSGFFKLFDCYLFVQDVNNV